MIRAAVFDFDGTLVMSNEIKRHVFDLVAGRFPGGREIVAGILRSTRADRTEIWARFADAVGAPHLAGALTAEYTAICHQQILACPERPGATEVLHRLRTAGVRCYVNSSTPAHALAPLVDARFPELFDGVAGAYGRKPENLAAMLAAHEWRGADVIVVGDGPDDREAAAACGCLFAGVAGGGLDGGALIDDLRAMLTAVGQEV